MKKIALIVLLYFINVPLVFCQDVYTYVNNTAGIPTYVDPLIPVFTNLTAIGTGVTTPCTWGFSGITGFTGLTYSTAGPCIDITLTATPGYTIDVTGFTAGLRRSTTGPTLARLAYSTDGISWTDEGIDHVPLNAGCATSPAGTTLASWSPFYVTNPTLHFRIYPYAASGMGGTIQIYGLSIIGSVRLLCTPPVVSVSPAAATICSGSSVALTGSGAGLGGVYTWSPGTGLSATTGVTVTASPTATTTYTVIGTTSVGCSDTTTAVVTVNPLPATTITPSGPLTFCIGDTVRLIAPSGLGYTYQWNNAFGAIPGATNQYFTTGATGIYTVDVTNGFGCTASSSAAIVTAVSLPVITVSPAGGSICLGGGGLSLTASGAGLGGAYAWGPTTGLTPAFGPTVLANPTATTTYTITGTSVIGCVGTTTVTVTVNPAPPATVVASGPLTFCAGDEVTLTGPVGYSYQWYNGPGLIAGATNNTYIATSSGAYRLVVTNSFGCSTTSSVNTVNTLPAPTALITVTGSAVFCAGGSVTLNAATGPGYVYQWNKDGSPIAGAIAPVYTASLTGAYTVRVTGTNGCSANAAGIMVNAVDLPFIENTGRKFCAGTTSTLRVNTGGAITGITYQWYRNGIAIPGAVNGSYMATLSGIYTCYVNIAGSCATTTAPDTITVYPTPRPFTTFDGTYYIANPGYVTYQWYLNTIAIPGATTTTLKPFVNGSYRVRVTDPNNCSAYSIEQNIYNVGVTNINATDIAVYPNPATTTLRITAPVSVTAQISGIDGKTILIQPNAEQINIAELPSGLYLLQLYSATGERLLTQKVMKQ